MMGVSSSLATGACVCVCQNLCVRVCNVYVYKVALCDHDGSLTLLGHWCVSEFVCLGV
jgi:hypothetical protein